ncbi:DNA polymerase III subunit gamma and tau, partial [Streptomyces europaeiscabiei]|nr:DNA polymerase III subunit gamma and tau [Streptomyces europaeiscabiei]MDX3875703.1 DNA polymerase III subunit gamma and tau [Streptomyces europaeiscabiei]
AGGGGPAPGTPAPPGPTTPPASGPPAAYAQPGPPAGAQAPAAYNPAAGGPDPRTLWPNILETVKNRRRFTWILLSQNAHVAGFDGTTLQIGFVNAGARDNFASSGSEDVLRAALSEQFNVHWKIEAVIDTSGGGTPPGAPGGYGSPAPAAGGYGGGGTGGGYGGGGAGGGYGGSLAPASRPAAPQASAGPRPAAPHQSTPSAPPVAAGPPPAPEPPPVSPEDDTPEDDDPDLDESALSGHDLIVRELGATVVDEIVNE